MTQSRDTGCWSVSGKVGKGLVVLVAGAAAGYATASFLGPYLYDRLGLIGSGLAIGALIYAVARPVEYFLDQRYPEQGR